MVPKCCYNVALFHDLALRPALAIATSLKIDGLFATMLNIPFAVRELRRHGTSISWHFMADEITRLVYFILISARPFLSLSLSRRRRHFQPQLPCNIHESQFLAASSDVTINPLRLILPFSKTTVFPRDKHDWTVPSNTRGNWIRPRHSSAIIHNGTWRSTEPEIHVAYSLIEWLY